MNGSFDSSPKLNQLLRLCASESATVLEIIMWGEYGRESLVLVLKLKCNFRKKGLKKTMKKLLEESQWYGWYLNQLLPKYVWCKRVNHYVARNSKFEKDIIFPRVDGLHWCTARKWSHLCTSPWWNNSRGERNVTCNIKALAYWTTEHHGGETIGRTQWMWLFI